MKLLQHPVVRSYLYLKWTAFGGVFYFFNLFMYALFLFCLSTFSLIVNNPQGDICKLSVFTSLIRSHLNNYSGLLVERIDFLSAQATEILITTVAGTMILSAIVHS